MAKSTNDKGSQDITDRGMQARPNPDADVWLRRPFGRGAGVFEGRITPRGARSFYFRYTAPDGSRVRRLIGPYSPRGEAGVTLAEARRIAAEWSAIYQAGARDLAAHFEQIADDGRVEREAKRAKQDAERLRAKQEAEALARRRTLRDLFDDWKKVALTSHTGADGRRLGRKDGGAYTQAQFERRVFPKLGTVPVEEVTRADLMSILDDVKAEGKLRTANVLLTDLKQMFQFALMREMVPRNPLDTVTKKDAGGQEAARDRVLGADEIKALARGMTTANLDARTEAAIWLTLATACRAGELAAARWEHVDLVSRTWYLPETKNERDHTIHLSDFALSKFRALEGLAADELAARLKEDPGAKRSDWVFPARRGKDTHVCVKTFGKQLADRQREPDRRMKHRSKQTSSLVLPGGRWTAHDLRRTAATIMASLGVSGDVIDECLNHVIESRVRRTYIRDRRLKEQAAAFDALGQRLAEIVPGVKT